MTRRRALGVMVVILLGAFFLRQYRLLDFPLFGDEVDEGDIALDILHGHLALYYPQNEGNEPLYQLSAAPFFAVLGDSVIANRFPSVAWSMVFVALMYAYGRALFHSRRVGAMAAFLAASLWWPTVFGRLGLREISQATLMVPALIPLAVILREADAAKARRAAIIGGSFAGLTSYTFLSGRGFPVIVVLFLAYAALAHRGSLRQHAGALAIYVTLMLAITLPLLTYLYLHPELDFHVRDLSERSWLAQKNFGLLFNQVLATLSMFTFQGDTNWAHNIAGRPVFPGLEGWIFYAGVGLCLWRWRKPEYAMPLIVIAVMLAPNILVENPPRWTRSIGILPGLIVTTVGPVEAVWVRLANFSRPRVVYAALVLLLGISIYARTAFDLFDVWIDHPGVYWMTLAFYDGAGTYVHRSPDATPVNYVMDVYTNWREHNVTRVAQRDDVEMRFTIKNALVFPMKRVVEADSLPYLDFRGMRVAFQYLASPAQPLLESFVDVDDPIHIDPRSDPEGNRPLRIYYISSDRYYSHIQRAIKSLAIFPETQINLAHYTVSDFLVFSGYEILNPTARPGQALNVLTYWRVLRAPPDLAIFLHLLDSNGDVVAQYDGFDVVTRDLKPDDMVVQLHALQLPAGLSNGTYRFEIGAYTRTDGQRLPLMPGGDHLWLQTWELGR